MFPYVVFALLLLSIVVPVALYLSGERNARRGKRALIGNMASFFAIAVIASVFIFSGNAYAAEGVSEVSDLAKAAAYIGAGLVTGLCCIGTGIAIGPAAAAAIGAISENEKVMGKAIIFVAMAEGVAIYGLLISFMILGRV